MEAFGANSCCLSEVVGDTTVQFWFWERKKKRTGKEKEEMTEGSQFGALFLAVGLFPDDGWEFNLFGL